MDYNPTYQFNDEAELSWRPWMDLSGVQFNEEDTSRTIWLQALPLGTYDHPVHGEIKITPERIKRFADNINNKVRGQDLDIDYDHKAIDTKAAGWVQAAEDRGPVRAEHHAGHSAGRWTARLGNRLKSRRAARRCRSAGSFA